MTTHTVGQQQANVSQQRSSAETKIENCEPIIFDLREKHYEAEGHGIRVVHFYIGDDDELCEEGENLIEENSVEIECA